MESPMGMELWQIVMVMTMVIHLDINDMTLGTLATTTQSLKSPRNPEVTAMTMEIWV